MLSFFHRDSGKSRLADIPYSRFSCETRTTTLLPLLLISFFDFTDKLVILMWPCWSGGGRKHRTVTSLQIYLGARGNAIG